MPHFYLDTSHVISMGLLNEQFEFIDFQTINDKKSGTRAHLIIDEFLKKHELEVKSIKSWFVLAGPGSYTGMRVSEGIAQILELEKLTVYSMYAYQIPEFAGMLHGQWITSAFKGQLFVYSWSESNKQSELKDLKDFAVSKPSEIYFHGELPKELLAYKWADHDTNVIIQSKSKMIFNTVKELGLRQQPQYFRAPEQEFVVSPLNAVSFREK